MCVCVCVCLERRMGRDCMFVCHFLCASIPPVLFTPPHNTSHSSFGEGKEGLVGAGDEVHKHRRHTL